MIRQHNFGCWRNIKHELIIIKHQIGERGVYTCFENIMISSIKEPQDQGGQWATYLVAQVQGVAAFGGVQGTKAPNWSSAAKSAWENSI